jgi:hypothetical protein
MDVSKTEFNHFMLTMRKSNEETKLLTSELLNELQHLKSIICTAPTPTPASVQKEESINSRKSATISCEGPTSSIISDDITTTSAVFEEKSQFPTTIPDSSNPTAEQLSTLTVPTLSSLPVDSVTPANALSEEVYSNSRLGYNFTAIHNATSINNIPADREVKKTTLMILSRSNTATVSTFTETAYEQFSTLGNINLQPCILGIFTLRSDQLSSNILVPKARSNSTNRFISAVHLIYDPGGAYYIFDPGGNQ